MKHTALYLRVSTEAQADEGYSLAAQAEKLEAYCRMKGIGRFTQYVDGGFSGSNLSRPAVTQLIDCIRRDGICAFVNADKMCKQPSRSWKKQYAKLKESINE